MDFSRLPEFYMPYPEYGGAESRERIEAATFEWAERLGGSGRAEVVRESAELAVRYCAFVERPGPVFALARYLTVACVIDQILERPEFVQRTIQGLLSVTRNPLGSFDDPVESAYAESLQEITGEMPEGLRRDALTSQRRWLLTYSDQVHTGIPTIAELKHYRQYTSNMEIQGYFQEFASASTLGDQLRSHPHVHRARLTMARHAGLCRDVLSAADESSAGYTRGALGVLRNRDGCTAQEAVEAANVLLTATLLEFERSCRIALIDADLRGCDFRALSVVLNGYRALIRGNFDCYLGARMPTPPSAGILPARRRRRAIRRARS